MTINRTHLAGLGIAIEQVEDATDMTELFYCLKDLIAQAQAAPEAEPVASVAYLDVGAGGYVDLGTDQPIEALEKMPYGRHMLGIIGTYGADGWKPSPSQPATKSEPVAYAAFSDNGNIRVWSRALNVIEMMAAQGCKAVPLYTAPQHDAGWREHSKQYAKGEKCPETIETLQAAWDRDQELMVGQKAEISKLKETINQLRQKRSAPPATADAVSVPRELLELCLAGFDDYWVTIPEGVKCTQQLRALLAQSQEVK